MKRLLLPSLFCTVLTSFSIHGITQSELGIPICGSLENYYCKLDLSKPIPGLSLDSLTGIRGIIYGKVLDPPPNYKDVLYARDPNRLCDDLDKQKNYCLSTPYDLRYYVYYPSKILGLKITCPLPFIIMFHGGSFYECPSIDNEGFAFLCRELAKRGFIVFNAEYRGGSIPDPRFAKSGYNFLSAQQILATYRACQDARGAIRSILKRQLENNNVGDFQLDTGKMFIGGISAGSLMAMNVSYYERQGQIDSAYGSPGLALGDIDADYYTGDTGINFFPKIKGVLNLWGMLGIDKSFWNDPSKFLQGNSNYPALISFQGAKDDLFYPGKQYLYFSADSMGSPVRFNFNHENRCLVYDDDFVLDKDPDSGDAIGLGADGLYNMLKNKNIPVEEYIDLQMGHGLDECDTCHGNSFFQSDFGTGLKDENSVYSYIAGRAATFFTAVITGTVYKLGKSKFIECVNKRVQCNTADNACDSFLSKELNCADYAQ